MESHERELIEKAVETNFELKKLYKQHVELDQKLKKLGKQSFLTQKEELEERRLKQLKLRGVERMLKMAAG
jgi:formyltetrahydrofolate synthetase